MTGTTAHDILRQLTTGLKLLVLAVWHFPVAFTDRGKQIELPHRFNKEIRMYHIYIPPPFWLKRYIQRVADGKAKPERPLVDTINWAQRGVSGWDEANANPAPWVRDGAGSRK